LSCKIIRVGGVDKNMKIYLFYEKHNFSNVLENCLLDLFVVLDLDLGSILIDNSFFLSLKSWK
jgi:hypothetical protein